MHIALFMMIAALILEQLCVNVLYWKYPFIVNTIGNIFGTIFYLSGIIAISLAIMIIFRSIKKKEFHLKKWDICFILVLVAGLFSVIFSDNKALTIIGSDYRMDGYFSYLIYAAFYIGARTIQKDKIRLNLMRFLTVAATFLCFDYILKGSLTSIFNNQNHFAYLLTISCMLLCGLYLYAKKTGEKVCYLLMFIINSIALLGTNTFGSYLAVLFGLIFALIFCYVSRKEKSFLKRMIFILSIFFLVSLGMNFLNGELKTNFKIFGSDINKIVTNAEDANDAGSYRIRLWKTAFRYIKDRPFFGYGPEGTYYEYMEETDYDRPHNEYIQCAMFMGIPAAVFYLLGLFLLFINCIKSKKNLPPYAVISGFSVFAYCISAFFGNTMYYTSPYFFMMLGLLSGISQEGNLFPKGLCNFGTGHFHKT